MLLAMPFVMHNKNAKVKKRVKFERMLEDHRKLLYPTAEEGQKKMGTTLELLQWKAKNGVSDKVFGNLLNLIKEDASEAK